MPGRRPAPQTDPAAFVMNPRGIAEFMNATAVARRTTIENFAFPETDEGKTKAGIMAPWPPKALIRGYYARNRDEMFLYTAIERNSRPQLNESPYARRRRLSAVTAANCLLLLGTKFPFEDVHKPAKCVSTISGLTVRASVDFLASLPGSTDLIAVIFNVSSDVSESADTLAFYSRVESEINWQILKPKLADLSAVWYIDLLTGKVVRRHTKSATPLWREIRTTCDDIMIAYHALIARRRRQQREG